MRGGLASNPPSIDATQIREAFESYVEEALRHLPEFQWAPTASIRSIVSYSLNGGGKRVRPSFLLALVSDISGDVSRAHFSVAAALEIIHSASLVHDDLPGIDNDDERRGRPTLHRQFGEAEAILIGDYMVPFAFSVCVEEEALDGSMRLEAVRILSEAYRSVCFGQLLDRAAQPGVDGILHTHRHKTAALFKAAAQLACLTSAAPQEHSTALIVLGEQFGMFFQLVDDFLDRDDDASNFFAGVALPEAIAAVDQSWLELEQEITRIEALVAGTQLRETRRIFEQVRARCVS